MKLAVFPGSFDPITNGHVDIVRRALPLFDEIVVAVGHNTEKKYLFPLATRINWLQEVQRGFWDRSELGRVPWEVCVAELENYGL